MGRVRAPVRKAHRPRRLADEPPGQEPLARVPAVARLRLPAPVPVPRTLRVQRAVSHRLGRCGALVSLRQLPVRHRVGTQVARGAPAHLLGVALAPRQRRQVREPRLLGARGGQDGPRQQLQPRRLPDLVELLLEVGDPAPKPAHRRRCEQRQPEQQDDEDRGQDAARGPREGQPAASARQGRQQEAQEQVSGGLPPSQRRSRS
mmetsp:Transcript_11528/g.22661  ORF Transcript_11528/g.22661 Transcript_11528/m.22661 type:complete len:204 (+) Transcript_11528:2270-2881(+)